MTTPIDVELDLKPASAALVINGDGTIALHISRDQLEEPQFSGFFLAAIASRLESEEWRNSIIDWMKDKLEKQHKSQIGSSEASALSH